MVAAVVYVLCFLTSLGCTLLLLKGYWRTKTRLLLWTGLCFASMAINNAALFADKVLLPNEDLIWIRLVPLLIGVCCLLYGLVWEAE
jgi:hypothetical protein